MASGALVGHPEGVGGVINLARRMGDTASWAEVDKQVLGELTDTEPLLAACARSHLAGIDAEIARTAQESERVKRALEYLAKCGYEFTARSFGWTNFSSTTNAGAFWGIQ